MTAALHRLGRSQDVAELLALAQEQAAGSGDDGLIGQVLNVRGNHLMRSRSSEEAIALFQGAAEHLGRAGLVTERLTALVGVAEALSDNARWEEAADVLASARADAAGRRGIAFEILLTQIEAAAVARQGRLGRSLALFRTNLGRFQRAGNVRGEALARDRIAVMLKQMGTLREALAEREKALALYRAGSDPWGLARCMPNQAFVLNAVGEHDEAEALLDETARLRTKIGDERGMAYTLGSLGVVAAGRGQHREAVSRLSEGLAIAQEHSDLVGQGLLLDELGRQQQLSGAAAAARRTFECALALHRDMTNGHLDAAEALLREALALHTQLELPGPHARAHLGLAVALARRGVPDLARNHLDWVDDNGIGKVVAALGAAARAEVAVHTARIVARVRQRLQRP